TGRWVLHSADGRRLVVYLKRHYQLGWWNALLARLWPGGDWSPAMQEANHLQWAHAQGVPVPAVVAAGEFLGPGGCFQSYLAVEELTGQLALHEAIPLARQRLSPREFTRWKQGLVAEMARLARLLHDRRHFHKDLYLCHYYIHEDDLERVPPTWQGRVALIDLHRLGHHVLLWRLYQSKDLAQLLYSSEIPGVTFRDRVAFWRAYRGQGTSSRSARWLLGLIRFRWHRYRRHNLRKRKEANA
ncbi:MAG: lipopolysaccharide kinase InaA family protein, partial [Gemmataceae bacterium]